MTEKAIIACSASISFVILIKLSLRFVLKRIDAYRGAIDSRLLESKRIKEDALIQLEQAKIELEKSKIELEDSAKKIEILKGSIIEDAKLKSEKLFKDRVDNANKLAESTKSIAIKDFQKKLLEISVDAAKKNMTEQKIESKDGCINEGLLKKINAISLH